MATAAACTHQLAVCLLVLIDRGGVTSPANYAREDLDPICAAPLRKQRLVEGDCNLVADHLAAGDGRTVAVPLGGALCRAVGYHSAHRSEALADRQLVARLHGTETTSNATGVSDAKATHGQTDGQLHSNREGERRIVLVCDHGSQVIIDSTKLDIVSRS